MSSHEDSTTGRNQEEKETEVVEEVDVVEDSTTGRNQEEKETEVVEEVDVEADPVLGGVTEAVGGGGDDPAAGGGGGSVRVGGSGSSTFSDVEVRAMPPSRQLEVVAQGRLLERQLRGLLGGPSKTTKELLQSLLLANAEAAAAADAQVADLDETFIIDRYWA